MEGFWDETTTKTTTSSMTATTTTKATTTTISQILRAVHKLRHPIRRYGGVSQKMTKDDRGGGAGVWQKMTDDDDEAGGRREKKLTALQDTLFHRNVAVKGKPSGSEICAKMSQNLMVWFGIMNFDTFWPIFFCIETSSSSRSFLVP